MALETATYLNELVVTNPLSSDPRADGDDHIRLLKAVLKATFTNISGEVSASHTELNHVVGVTSSIQTQLNTLSSGKASMPAGTTCLFYQAAAPTGWTKITTQNDKALRVVSGSGGGTGGSVAFTAAFASKSVTGTVGDTTLTIAQIPPHAHAINIYETEQGASGVTQGGPSYVGAPFSTGYEGGGQPHTHTFTGTAINLAVQYIDVIIASRD